MNEADIAALQPVVLAIAHSIHRTLPPGAAALEDLISEGWVGAVAAASHYSPEVGTTLAQWCRARIDGAMWDYLRRHSPGGRSKRERPKLLSIDAGEVEQFDQPDRAALNTFLDVENAQDLQRIRNYRGANTPIPIRHRRILRDYFFKGQGSTQIAKNRRISPGRVSQIIAATVGSLAERALVIKERSEHRCPCGQPLWAYNSAGKLEMRKTYCSPKCWNEYRVAKVCREPGCTRPPWRKGRKLCRLHFRFMVQASDAKRRAKLACAA